MTKPSHASVEKLKTVFIAALVTGIISFCLGVHYAHSVKVLVTADTTQNVSIKK